MASPDKNDQGTDEEDASSGEGKGESAGASLDREPDELMSGFTGAAIPGIVPIPKNFNGKGIHITGDRTGDETDAEIAERKRRYQDFLDEQLIEDQQRRKEAQRMQQEAGLNASGGGGSNGGGGDYEESWYGKMKRSWGLQVIDKGDYMRVTLGRDKQGKPDQERIEKQVRAMVMTGVLSKGWKTLYLYGPNGKIDPTLSAIADKVVAEMSQPGRPLHGREVKVSRVKMQDAEPWKLNNPISRGLNSAEKYIDEKAKAYNNWKGRLADGWTLRTAFKPKADMPSKTAGLASSEKEEAGASAGHKSGGPSGMSPV